MSADLPARTAEWRYWFAWWCLFVLTNPGDLGSVDTARRLQVAHSWWTSAPEVVPDDWPSFGIPACGGVLRAWYGPGQSALLLPADIIVSQVTAAPRLRGAGVALLVFPALAVVSLMVAEALLQALGLDARRARLSTAVFAIATSFLPYTQINQENSLLFALLAGATLAALRYAATGSLGAIVISMSALGVSVLTRLPAVVDVLLVLSVALALRARMVVLQGMANWRSVVPAAVGATLVLCGTVVVDRLYHHWRFCEWSGTYFDRVATTIAIARPNLPAGFPFSTPFWEGVTGFLWSPDFSILVTDPIALLGLCLFAVTVTRWSTDERAVFGIGALSLAALMVFYARYYDWWGGASWGSRFTTAPAQLLCLVTLGVVARRWSALSKPWRFVTVTLVTTGALVNIAATVFWYQLELQQREASISALPIVLSRLTNIAALVGGTWTEWGLIAPGISSRLIRPNVLAWLSQPSLGPWGAVVLVAWSIGLATAVFAIARSLRRQALAA